MVRFFVEEENCRRNVFSPRISERREKERLQREQRREDDLKRRNQAQIEENLERMKLYEETAQSFGNKAESKLDKLKEQALKEKQAFIEKERKA